MINMLDLVNVNGELSTSFMVLRMSSATPVSLICFLGLKNRPSWLFGKGRLLYCLTNGLIIFFPKFLSLACCMDLS